MEVNVHHAKTTSPSSSPPLKSGEEVIIARNGKPAVKLVMVSPPIRKSRKHMLGVGMGKIWMADAPSRRRPTRSSKHVRLQRS